MNKVTAIRTRVSRIAAIVGVVLIGVAASGAQAQDKEARMLIQTISEENTEIRQLAAQQAAFRRMGGRENERIAAMFGRWIREHKAASPTLIRLTRKHGGNPAEARILKPPVLGDKATMLHATMMDHMKAEQTSQIRFAAADDRAVKMAMRARARLSRRHMREMQPIHDRNVGQNMRGGMQHGSMNRSGGTMSGRKTAAMCPHCNVQMVNGKCPQCGMTADQMKHDHA